MVAELLSDFDRRRAGWWLVATGIVGIVGLFLLSFIGTFIFGLFVYYGARPINRWVQARIGSREIAATITLLFIVLPTLALLGYTGFVAFREFAAFMGPDAVGMVLERLPGNQQSVAEALQNLPWIAGQLSQLSGAQQGVSTALGTLGTISNVLLHLTLALTFAFFLYHDGHRLQSWYRQEVGGCDTAAYSYLAGVDADLEVVYFGNVLTVLAVTVGSIIIYNGYNFLAPTLVSLPFPTLLAVLTGLATFIPLVVGKVVYVPVTAYLAWQAVQASANFLIYPVVLLVIAFFLLDILPQSIVRPYISGQTMHKGAVLFAYILGAALFGWYGLFLGPFLLVLVIQFANIVLGDLIHGNPFSPRPTTTTHLGTDPINAEIDVTNEATLNDTESHDEQRATNSEDTDGTNEY